MAAVIERTDNLAETSSEVWAPGSAVLALGENVEGEESLALWQVSPAGAATGSWVVPFTEAFSSQDVARRLLIPLERRAIAATDPAAVSTIIEKLTATAAIDAGGWWDSHLFSPLRAFDELLARREAYDATVDAHRQGGKSAAVLEWARDFSGSPAPVEFEDLRQISRLGIAAGAPVVSEVLTVSRVLGWLVEVWAETEQVKGRRAYIRETHGAPEALPPSWLGAVQAASATRLPL
jgi:hypothetical protein